MMVIVECQVPLRQDSDLSIYLRLNDFVIFKDNMPEGIKILPSQKIICHGSDNTLSCREQSVVISGFSSLNGSALTACAVQNIIGVCSESVVITVYGMLES